MVRILVRSTDHSGDTVVSEVSSDGTWVFQSLVPGEYSVQAFADRGGVWQSISDSTIVSLSSGGIVNGYVIPVTSTDMMSSDAGESSPPSSIVSEEFDLSDLSNESAAIAAATDELLIASPSPDFTDPASIAVSDSEMMRTGRIVGQLEPLTSDTDGEPVADRSLQVLAIRRMNGSLVAFLEVSADTNWQFEVDGLEPGNYLIESVAGESDFESIEINVVAGRESRINLLLKLKPIESVANLTSASTIGELNLTAVEVNSLYAAMGLVTAGGFAIESVVSQGKMRQTYRPLQNTHPVIDFDHAVMLDREPPATR